LASYDLIFDFKVVSASCLYSPQSNSSLSSATKADIESKKEGGQQILAIPNRAVELNFCNDIINNNQSYEQQIKFIKSKIKILPEREFTLSCYKNYCMVHFTKKTG